MESINKLMENDRFASYVGIELVEVKPGHAVVKMDIADKHLNGVDIIQGGAIFTLADFAFAAAANACGQVTVAINANITYYKASGGRSLLAEAKEAAGSARIVNYIVEVFNEHRESIAQVNITGYRKKKSLDQ